MTSRTWTQRRPTLGFIALAFFMLLSFALTACGQPSHPAKRNGPPQPLIIVPNTGGDLVQNFNPFLNGAVNSYGQFGPVYETLLFFNRADGTEKPWLADSATVSPDATQITFKLHPGIQWSDGTPFTADDVAFTFNVMQQYSAADYLGTDSSIKKVTAIDPQTVQMTLTSPNSSILWLVAGQTWIVSQHIWSSVGDPTKYTDKVPVGTGPYVFKSFTPQLIDFTKNSHFWQPGKPIVPEIRFPAFNGNTTAEPAMNSDQTDWNGLYTPNVSKTFIQRDPAHNHYNFPPSDPLILFMNLKKAPFDQLAVRQAINLAIDRQKISTIGESGYDPIAHPTGLILPANKQFLDPTYANSTLTMDTSQASQILASAGYKAGSDGILVGPNGKKLSINMAGVTGYTDWDTDYQIIADNLKQVGIKLNITDNDPSTVQQDIQNGNFDMAIWYETPGPTPYYIYNEVLGSGQTAPIGQSAPSNFERWNDPASDALLTQYNSTSDLGQQQQAMYGLEKIVVEQLPVIFLVNEPYWYEYNTLKYVGWPDQGNFYAEPSPYTYPDDEIVLLNLHQ
ncbi:MAG TPA: ABC transporter substrate-binding protein [Ktedonobacterales bacterium]|nr:ABC transporter substrate-binding protein [Ktedonobacterales bacterium]